MPGDERLGCDDCHTLVALSVEIGEARRRNDETAPGLTAPGLGG